MELKYPGGVWLVSASPAKDEQGRLTHVVHVARDLTEQKALENQYRHAQRLDALGTLAGGVAHDFNNLLQVISGFGELLAADESGGTQRQQQATAIVQAAKRGSALTRQLLAFSRRTAEGIERHPLNLNDIVREARQMLDRLLLNQVAIRPQLAPDLWPTRGDSAQIHQVLMNLGVNSAHAMPDGGTLTLETRNVTVTAEDCRVQAELKPGPYVVVSVTDSGQGMDSKTLERMYEPFFTTKGVGRGTGLGLSVVYGIVKEHSGTVLCYSEVGVGTTFRIYLPALLQPASPFATGPAYPPAALPGGTETILVVDGGIPIRSVLSQSLEKAGYTVLQASDGESALLRYREASRRIQLTILDLGMPGMGGWECLRQ